MKKSTNRKKKSFSVKNKSSNKEKVRTKGSSKSTRNTRAEIVNKGIPKWFYLIMLMIPLLFFLLLEVGLQYFSYGYDLSQWSEVGEDKLMINKDIGRRYFNSTNFQPKTSDDTFDKQKRPNTFRVFVLGGSSAAGFPFMPMGSFSSYIKRRLELAYPDSKIEVVNISMTAINSYTVLDLVPGVLDQKPDLILIYAGHNEFYGALGVGSVESFGSSRFVKKITLSLNNFKTTQLVKDIIFWVSSLFSDDPQIEDSSTLMSKMAKNKSIQFDSDIFNRGVEQFSSNLSEIIEDVKGKNIPLIIGRLVSNYRDQKPFVSLEAQGQKTAEEVYEEAQSELNNPNQKISDSLFNLAKDLDALRFRAPEKINDVITNLSTEFGIPTVHTDSIFNSHSPYKITGNNLMVDHLHPNIEGYRLLGNAFYEKMQKFNCLPKNIEPKIPFHKQDSSTLSNLVFTKLDSVIGNNIVTLLKNDWPFVEKKNNSPKSVILQPKDYIDSVALRYIENNISYVDAYFEAATLSLRKDKLKDYVKYMNTLIYRYPGLKDINTAVKYFYDRRKVNPQDYTNKRLGIISFYSKNYDETITYLSEVYKTNSNDSEILYYLTSAYVNKRNFNLADKFIKECLRIDPNNEKYLLLKKKINKMKSAS